MRNNYKVCPKCGGIMNRQSRQCRTCYEKERVRPENYVSRTCPICGKGFTVHKSQLKRGQGGYCSRTCARKGSPTRKKTRLLLVCFVCGRKFEKHLSEIKKNVGDKYFCSLACWYSYNQGENHYLWSGGQHKRMNPCYRKWRKAVMERDHYLCRRCHSRENLEVHHIYKFNEAPELRWDVGNGITLCKRCHRIVTGNEESWTDNFFDMISLEL